MKQVLTYIIIVVVLISTRTYSQKLGTSESSKKSETTEKESDSLDEIGFIKIRAIESYLVEEIVNQKFGGYTTSYRISKPNMIKMRDLGPNNKRIITPIYGKEQIIPIKNIKSDKKFLKSPNFTMLALLDKNKSDSITISVIPCLKEAEEELQSSNNELSTNSKSEKFIYKQLIETYERVAEKGCKSTLIFQKLGDAYFFEGNYQKAVKWYEELIKLTTDLDSIYSERYAYSLRAIGQKGKSNEIKK